MEQETMNRSETDPFVGNSKWWNDGKWLSQPGEGHPAVLQRSYRPVCQAECRFVASGFGAGTWVEQREVGENHRWRLVTQSLSSTSHRVVTTPFQPQMRWETHREDAGERIRKLEDQFRTCNSGEIESNNTVLRTLQTQSSTGLRLTYQGRNQDGKGGLI